MGAKFKAPLDSRCFAEMEEQLFRLPLPPCVCLSFALLSFNLLFPCFTLFFHCFPPFILHPPLLWAKASALSFQLSSPLTSFSPVLALSLPLIAFSIFDLVVRAALRSPLVLLSHPSTHHPPLYLNPAFITCASLSNLTDIDQRGAAGMLSWCKFVLKSPINPWIQTEPRPALSPSQKTTAGPL